MIERRESRPKPEIINPLKKVLIDNRGEIALRAIKTCMKLGIEAVLAVSDADFNTLPFRTALALQRAGESISFARIGGEQASQSYNNVDNVILTAKINGCDSVYPGYGFLSEEAEAAKKIQVAGLRFIGPSPEVIDLAGNKRKARVEAHRLGIRILPGTTTLEKNNPELALQKARELQFPVMLKAEKSAAGKGNLVVKDEDEFKAAFQNLTSNFVGIYLEKYIEHARHIEVQIAADKYGNVMSLGERDCSAQRRFQKVVETSPPMDIPAKLLRGLARQATLMAKNIGYVGLGTWEFIYDTDKKEFYFLEVNPRIQVEHPVTEERTGLDLVAMQLDIEQGKKLLSLPHQKDNFVIEARVYAEDPERNFQPESGKIQLMQIPAKDDVRIEPGNEEGDTIMRDNDKTIVKIISTGQTHEEARLKLAETLSEMVITGVSTNREFLLWLIDTPEFCEGKVTTAFIEKAWAEHQKQRARGIEGFLAYGNFNEESITRRSDPEKLPQNIRYQRKGIPRDYRSELERFQREHPDTCAFRFGTFEDKLSGIRFALGFFDFERFGGTLSEEEALAIADLFELANKEGLPVVMISQSGGARQQVNKRGLIAMDYAVAVRRRYPNIPFYNIYKGPNLGGVTASIAEQADFRIATQDAVIGLTGLANTAKIEGKDDLPKGTLSAVDHFQARNVDFVVDDLDKAYKYILKLIATLDNYPERVPYDIRDFDLAGNAQRVDRPAQHRFRTRLGSVGRSLQNRFINVFHHDGRLEADVENLTNERRLELINNPYRPTPADFLSPEIGTFEAVAPLSNLLTMEKVVEQHVPIIGGIVILNGQPVMVLGQQSQLEKDQNGKLVKRYLHQRPEDYRWALEKVNFANRHNLPIILLGDAMAADASLKSQYGGICYELSQFLGALHDVNVSVISVNLGNEGSGGGLTFIRPLDGAIALSNSVGSVSEKGTMAWILTGEHQSVDKQDEIFNQLHDATAQGGLEELQYDVIIQEPIGGAHKNPKAVALALKRELINMLVYLNTLSPTEKKERRYQRAYAAVAYGTRPV